MLGLGNLGLGLSAPLTVTDGGGGATFDSTSITFDDTEHTFDEAA